MFNICVHGLFKQILLIRTYEMQTMSETNKLNLFKNEDTLSWK